MKRMKLNDLPESMRIQVQKKLVTQYPRKTPNVEQVVSDASMGSDAIPTFDTPVCITVHHVRRRMADHGGLQAKAPIDELVDRRILLDDNYEAVKEKHTQEKAKYEKTIITIEEI